MNGKMVENKPIYVSLAQCKMERKLHLQTRFNSLSRNVVSSTITSSPHQHPIFSQAAAPATVLSPQPPFRGYNFQPYLMCGSRLPNSCPPIHIPNFIVPQPFRPRLYPPALPVGLHHSMPMPLLQPKLWNQCCNI